MTRTDDSAASFLSFSDRGPENDRSTKSDEDTNASDGTDAERDAAWMMQEEASVSNMAGDLRRRLRRAADKWGQGNPKTGVRLVFEKLDMVSSRGIVEDAIVAFSCGRGHRCYICFRVLLSCVSSPSPPPPSSSSSSRPFHLFCFLFTSSFLFSCSSFVLFILSSFLLHPPPSLFSRIPL